MTQSSLQVSTIARSALRSRALLSALALGVLADTILREPEFGLNIALWAVAGVVVLAYMLRRRHEGASRESWWLIGAALLFAVTLMLRDADVLGVLSMMAAVALLMMAAGHATAPWLVGSQFSEVVFALVRVASLCASGPLDWGRSERVATATPDWRRRTRTFLRGALMAAPALLVLAALLMSADPVFSRLIKDTFRIDLNALFAHLFSIALVAWFASGYLRAILIRDGLVISWKAPQPAFAAAEVSVALWILNLLFLSFMAVQLRYLFGGAGLVEATAGLSYAEYARSGFFELIATAALVLPILLVADWVTATDAPRARSVLHVTTLVMVVLLFGVIASAGYRMSLYEKAYGLTEQRLYVSAFIVWLTALLGWLVVTVLRGRRDRFVFGGVVAGIGCLTALLCMNPDAFIASVNLDRAATGEVYDGAYLPTLSADAVPAILSRLDRLPLVERCRVEQMLREKWSGARDGGWLTWNLSDWNARKLVASHQWSVCPTANLHP